MKLIRAGPGYSSWIIALPMLAMLTCGESPDDPATEVTGYADLHVHQFSRWGFGGGWYYGDESGPIGSALGRCSGNVLGAPGRRHAELSFSNAAESLVGKPALTAVVAGLSAATGIGSKAVKEIITNRFTAPDAGAHGDRRHGYCQEHAVVDWQVVDGRCRGNAVCGRLSESECGGAQPCSWEPYSIWPFGEVGHICRDNDDDDATVGNHGVFCNLLGSSQCEDACYWDPEWGSVTVVSHHEDHGHDWRYRWLWTQDVAGWPSWFTRAHQQVYEDWLYTTHQDGLQLMVMIAVSNEVLCEAFPAANRQFPCDDYSNVTRQIDKAKEFDAAHDWYEIAYSPAQAREIIERGHLAVVLSVEASDIFSVPDPVARLHDLHGRGVRTLLPMHQLNNDLGGVAYADEALMYVDYARHYEQSGFVQPYIFATNGGNGTPEPVVDASQGIVNRWGLSGDGRAFIREMIELGMPIDMDHMSEKSKRDTYGIAQDRCDFPLYQSHSTPRELLPGPDTDFRFNRSSEYASPGWVYDMIRETGGMVGVRTAPDAYFRGGRFNAAMSAAGLSSALPLYGCYTPGSLPQGLETTCYAHEGHLGYSLEYLHRVMGVDVALGTDFNGFIAQIPFWGQPGDRVFGGLAHIGKVPELLDRWDGGSPLGNLDLDDDTFDNLRHESAERFIRMWERAEEIRDTGCTSAGGEAGKR